MCSWVVAFLPSRDIFQQEIAYNIVVEVSASGPPHMLGPWLGLSKDLLPVKYSCSYNASFL